jgi:hypothetical protein
MQSEPSWSMALIAIMEDAVLGEHWGVIQDEAKRERSRSGLPVFGENFQLDHCTRAIPNMTSDPACRNQQPGKRNRVLADDHHAVARSDARRSEFIRNGADMLVELAVGPADAIVNEGYAVWRTGNMGVGHLVKPARKRCRQYRRYRWSAKPERPPESRRMTFFRVPRWTVLL